jgi:hypothetical protein
MTTTTMSGPQASTLEIGVGFASGGSDAVVRAASAAAGRLNGAAAHLALIVTATPMHDAMAEARSVLGRVQVAGGSAASILTDDGPMKSGALVVCVANADGAASGVAATSGRDLADAGQAAARLVLSGWPFRARYPRGLGIAFARSDAGDSALRFLDSWRDFMGPKMRTVCGVLASPVLYGATGKEPRVSVACLEASYATGLGWSDATGEPSADALVHGAADATLTAVKRLDGRPARLVLVVETAARHARLGAAVREEWAAIRGQLDEGTPCAGWLVEDVAAYGRGVQPAAAPGALVVVAVGDSPRGGEAQRS